MASEEEVDITIKTIADTSGAQQVATSLNGVQQAATQVQQQVNANAQAMNLIMTQAMRGLTPTMENFRQQFEAIRKQFGQAPALGPEAFGITPDVQQKLADAGKQAATYQ